MKLLFLLTVLMFTFTIHASESHCVSQIEAAQAASNNLEVLRAELHSKSTFWISRQKILEYIQNLQYSENENKYKSGILAKWTCAAGSDCYVGVEVDCNGNSGIYLFAD